MHNSNFFWRPFFIAAFMLLAGCSTESKDVVLTAQGFQQQINVGYLAPQIRTFDLQPVMMVQLYLDTPQVAISNDLNHLEFIMRGKMDAEILGNQLSEVLPVLIHGQADLIYKPEEQAIFLNHIDIHDAQVDFDVMLFRAIMLSQLEEVLAHQLEQVPLISLVEAPELGEQLRDMAQGKSIQALVYKGKVVFHPVNSDFAAENR